MTQSLWAFCTFCTVYILGKKWMHESQKNIWLGWSFELEVGKWWNVKLLSRIIFEGNKSNICVLYKLYRLYSCFKVWGVIAHGITSFLGIWFVRVFRKFRKMPVYSKTGFCPVLKASFCILIRKKSQKQKIAGYNILWNAKKNTPNMTEMKIRKRIVHV